MIDEGGVLATLASLKDIAKRRVPDCRGLQKRNEHVLRPWSYTVHHERIYENESSPNAPVVCGYYVDAFRMLNNLSREMLMKRRVSRSAAP